MAIDSDFESDDELLAATQVAAATVVVAAPLAQEAAVLDAPAVIAKRAAAVDARVLCAICSINLSRWTIQDRAVHMNACLDATAMQNRYECPSCGKELTDYNEQRRMAHVNMCLDRICGGSGESSSVGISSGRDRIDTGAAAATAGNMPDESVAHVPPPSNADAYNCMICGTDLSDKGLEAKIRHVKQCGQRFGVRASDVAALQQDPQQQSPQEGRLSVFASEQVLALASDSDAVAAAGESAQLAISSTAAAPNAFAVMMRASAAPSSVLSSTIGRVGEVVSNAFDMLMKGSKTQAVLSSAATTSSSVGGASHFGKKRRVGNGVSSSSWSASSSSSSYDGASHRRCPDFKCIRGTQPPFIVDGFRYASKALSSVYFLTHFHSDHYTGLDKRFDCGVIYCNAVTAALVVQELRIDSKWVHPVPMNTPVVIHDTHVTFMDANHCPGAAIVLFRLPTGATYLHTGDFRYDRKMLSYAPLQSYVPQPVATTTVGVPRRRLDGIYLDTTYADPKYVFPTQQAAIDHALALVAKYGVSDKILYLFGSYSIGKERLFMEVARRYRRKVCVSRAKLKFIATFGWPEADMNLLTTETGATNLHVVPMMDLKMEHLTALLAKHRLRFRQIVAFRPTGWTFSKASASLSTCRTDASGNIHLYGVPYSEHSSFAELAEFVQVMDPHTIIPTVNCHNDKAVKKQVDALRQTAFGSVASLLRQPHVPN